MGAEQPQQQSAAAYKILIVEDNPNDRILYKRLLDKSDITFETVEAGTVGAGIESCRTGEADCILVDYRLPDGDGIDFIKSCKEAGLASDAAIVMVTGQGSEQTAVAAMKLGALDYIAKNTVMEGFFVQSILNAIERAQLKRQVRQYQTELEKSYTALSEFTHTVSHDLKAPLRRIRQYCDLLKEDMGDRLGPDGTEHINRLTIIARRMQRLIDDLLALSRTMNEREKKTRVDFSALAAEVIDELDVVIKENKASVTVEGPIPHVMAFPVRLKELLQNLIINAIKYRSQADPVIRITCAEDPDEYIFSVSDNGEGIAEKYHESIFKAFERLHTQDEIEGSGLGLSICSKVVELHGGRIWVESERGKGATFKFTIPKS
jgi:signal transduction histidine kinase